jgi:hypothetical protein
VFALSDVIALFHFVPYARSQARDAVRLRFDDNVLYCAINGLQAATSLDIIKASVALLSVCTAGDMPVPMVLLCLLCLPTVLCFSWSCL